MFCRGWMHLRLETSVPQVLEQTVWRLTLTSGSRWYSLVGGIFTDSLFYSFTVRLPGRVAVSLLFFFFKGRFPLCSLGRLRTCDSWMSLCLLNAGISDMHNHARFQRIIFWCFCSEGIIPCRLQYLPMTCKRWEEVILSNWKVSKGVITCVNWTHNNIWHSKTQNAYPRSLIKLSPFKKKMKSLM